MPVVAKQEEVKKDDIPPVQAAPLKEPDPVKEAEKPADLVPDVVMNEPEKVEQKAEE